MRQMSYSVCRFWAYDESKKLLGAGKYSLSLSILCMICMGNAYRLSIDNKSPPWKLALAGTMGMPYPLRFLPKIIAPTDGAVIQLVVLRVLLETPEVRPS